jgi:hypothetical protein
MTVVDRSTSCILGWAVDQERSEETLQKMVDHAPQAAFYFSDLFATYRQVVYYPAIHRCLTKAKPIASKEITLNCGIIWHDSHVNRDVFRAVSEP